MPLEKEIFHNMNALRNLNIFKAYYLRMCAHKEKVIYEIRHGIK